jgi:CRISPR-associated protein Csm1
MSVQIFLQGKLLGIESFLSAPPDDAVAFEGKCRWISLLSETLPRALLSELGLSRMLLGTSGGAQFLLVLSREVRERAVEFLEAASADLAMRSQGKLRLVWASTENLGDWTIVRRRLNEEMDAKIARPAAEGGDSFFRPFDTRISTETEAEGGWLARLALEFRDAKQVSWSPGEPALVKAGEGKHTWPLGPGDDAISLPRHTALGEGDSGVAALELLGSRATGRKAWGVLRGDVDRFGLRLRRATTIEEHVQLSVLYKRFFAGELEVICSLPEYWQKVSILYSGGDDFAIAGAWDALIPLAAEVHRLFQLFAEQQLREFPGLEAKTLSMGIALQRTPEDSVASVFDNAGAELAQVQVSGKDGLGIFGRTIEWKHLPDAASTKATMVRLLNEFRCSPQFLYELDSFYREVAAKQRGRIRNDRIDRPWRFHRRLNLVLETPFTGRNKTKEFNRLQSELIADFTGKRASQVRLRPAGRVALEWARLETETNES